MKFPSWISTFLIAALGFTSCIFLQTQVINRRVNSQTAAADREWLEQEERRLQLLQKLPKSGFGYNNLIAAHTYLTFLQYFGDDVARVDRKTGYRLSPEYFKIIVQRNPKFVHSYIFLSGSISIFAGQASVAVDLMNEGVKSLVPEKQPYAYTVWRRKAIDELLFLGDEYAARRSYLQAADAADRATFPPDALPETKTVAASSRRSAQLLEKNRNSKPVRIGAWSQVLASAPDRKTQLIAVQEMQKLGSSIVITPQGEIKFTKNNPIKK